MATRFDVERAVLASDLPAGCRHLVHVLCVRVDADTNTILRAYQPSLSELARDTGRDRRTVQRYLSALERRGWVTRDRPPRALAARLHRRTQYAIHIPTGFPQARDIMSPKLGTPGPGTRDTAPPGLGTPPPEARDTVPHRSSGSSGSSAGQIDAIIKAIHEKTGKTISEDWAERIRAQILGARDNVRHPEAYLRRVILAAPSETYLPTPGPAAAAASCTRCHQAHATEDCPY